MSKREDFNSRIRAVAFDMDGLMFNTEDLYDEAGEELLSRRGLHFDRELKLKMMGLPGNVAFQVMKDFHDLEDSIEVLKVETREIFASLLPNRIETMPGLLHLLELLESSRIPKCVATSSHRDFARRALGMFDLETRFEFVLTSDDVQRGKPDPEVYLTAASKFGIDSNQMLVFEDSLVGSRAAAASGAMTIAVPTEHSQGQDFSHANHVVESLEDPLIHEILMRI